MAIVDELAKLHSRISFKNAGTSREERIKIIEAAADALGKSAASAPSQPIEKVLELLPDCLEVSFRRRAGRYELILMDLDIFSNAETLVEALAGAIRGAMEAQLDEFKDSAPPVDASQVDDRG